VSATSPRSQIVKRLQDCIPSLGAVQGAVSLESVFQGNVKANTAYVYRVSTQALLEKVADESQLVQDFFAVIVVTKNIRDAGGDDSSDENDDLCTALMTVLMGWTPPGSAFSLEYERGEISFQRNMLIWSEFYSLKRIVTKIPLFHEPNSLMKINKKAATDIYEMRVVATNNDDTLYHPSVLNQLDINRIIGIALKSGMAGNFITVQLAGVLVYPQWNWTPNQLVYLNNNGEMTQIPTAISMGYANTPKSLVIRVEHLEKVPVNESFIVTAGETIYAGMPITLNTEGIAFIASTQPVGVAITSGNAGNEIQYHTDGVVVLSDWSGITGSLNLVIGSTYYSDPQNSGKLTAIAPNIGFIQPIGTAISPTVLDLEIGQITILD